jgi:hypothetical protein
MRGIFWVSQFKRLIGLDGAVPDRYYAPALRLRSGRSSLEMVPRTTQPPIIMLTPWLLTPELLPPLVTQCHRTPDGRADPCGRDFIVEI